MRKILVFGTFDIIHPGHHFLLKEAKKLGDKLYVVIGRDSTVKEVKGRFPYNKERKRLENIKKISFVHKALLGQKKNKYRIIEKIKPDIICLGYDQIYFTKKLKEELNKRNLKTKIIRIKKAIKPKEYKSSKIRKKLEKNKEITYSSS